MRPSRPVHLTTEAAAALVVASLRNLQIVNMSRKSAQKYYIPCLDGVCSGEWLEAGVNFDSGEESVFLEEVYEWCSLSGALE